MAGPFGNHPTFGDYLRWAKEQGCAVTSGYGPGGPLTKILLPDATRWVIESGTPQTEFLLPRQIAYLDRRLGLKSPWDSWD